MVLRSQVWGQGDKDDVVEEMCDGVRGRWEDMEVGRGQT